MKFNEYFLTLIPKIELTVMFTTSSHYIIKSEVCAAKPRLLDGYKQGS